MTTAFHVVTVTEVGPRFHFECTCGAPERRFAGRRAAEQHGVAHLRDVGQDCRWICKGCGAQSPPGIGYVGPVFGPLPAPDPDCDHDHLTGGPTR